MNERNTGLLARPLRYYLRDWKHVVAALQAVPLALATNSSAWGDSEECSWMQRGNMSAGHSGAPPHPPRHPLTVNTPHHTMQIRTEPEDWEPSNLSNRHDDDDDGDNEGDDR